MDINKYWQIDYRTDEDGNDIRNYHTAIVRASTEDKAMEKFKFYYYNIHGYKSEIIQYVAFQLEDFQYVH